MRRQGSFRIFGREPSHTHTHTELNSSVISSSDGRLKMYLVSSIMNGHMEGTSHTPDMCGACLSRGPQRCALWYLLGGWMDSGLTTL